MSPCFRAVLWTSGKSRGWASSDILSRSWLADPNRAGWPWGGKYSRSTRLWWFAYGAGAPASSASWGTGV